ncbi:helix-turn-helix domain-containing protein [Thermomicrobium sp. 4228-Ro]|uniref:helix-turn-helix domain-containing protein n=1 Tax=Thermomicrobium sp. 4228-Ro TaxID=2993937 RepID=UPI002248834D|nr:helix-turn-helix domain-containing protein [Thermomicrobium sp. 4228-Ro]MCX2727538.1 helix-turn-helix domain-containing protein [Thermomicrobium sp. 4228-Ro]
MAVETHEETLSIHELAERSGVPPRRIRYYVAKGLLPPPLGRGPSARYGRQHLERLRAIKELRERRLGLEAIRERFAQSWPETPAGPSLWHQWELAPGVLLWVRVDLPEDERERVAALVDVGRRLLRRDDST